MLKTPNEVSANLSDFCKITKVARDGINEIAGNESADTILQQGWEEAFEGGHLRAKGTAISFHMAVTSPEGEERWAEVLLRKSNREGESLPYFIYGINKLEAAPREAESLEGFAFLRWDLYDELAGMALAEPWSFTGKGNDLLRFYLNGTFLRLVDEGKLGYATDTEGDMCVWCTGLVNAHYEDIYCFCVPNDRSDASQHWVVRGFCTSGSSHLGQRLRRAFGSEPPLRANYFENVADIVYDGSLDLSIDYQHIYQRVHRIGIPALRVVLASSTKAMDVIGRASNAKPEAREGILKELNQVVGEDTVLQQSLYNALALAAERARARARYMYASALPSWNPRGGGSIAFCLPLCLVVEERVDTVLVARLVKDAKEPYYEGKTIFDVRMAYKNARTIQRTDGMTGWVSSAFADESDQTILTPSAFAAPAHAATPSLALTPGIGSTPVSQNPVAQSPKARLSPLSEAFPALLVCEGDTIGFVRRPQDESPRIQLPQEEAFYGVSQMHGRFSYADGGWTYTHSGSNWTQITRKDGSVEVLEEKGSSTSLESGDTLSFTNSPEYRFER